MDIFKRIIQICLYLVLAAPLLVWGKFLFPFITPKTLYFRMLVEIALAAYIILIITKPEYRPRFSKLTWLVFIYFLIITLTSFLGVDLYRSFWGNIERGEGLLTIYHVFVMFFLTSVVFREKKEWLRYFDVSVAINLLICLYALGQKLEWKFLLQSAGGSRLTATIGNASFLAAYVLLNLFLIMFLFVNKKNIGWRIYYAISFLFSFYILFQTETRGALLGFLGGLVIFAVLSIIFSKNKKLKFSSIGLFLFLIIICLTVWLSRNQSWVVNNSTLNRLVTISSRDVTTQSRFLGWNASWRGWKDRFIFGYGYENFNIAYNKYFPAKVYRDAGSQVWFDRAHNIIFDQAVANGLIGLAAYLAIIGGAIWFLFNGLIKTAKKDLVSDNPSSLSATSYIILIALIVSYFAQNFFVFDTLGTYIVSYSVLGFVSFISFSNKKKEAEKKSKTVAQPFLLVIAALILIFFLYFFNIRLAQSNQLCARGLSLAYNNVYRDSIINYKKALEYETNQAPEIRQSLSQIVPRAMRSGVFSAEEIRDNYNFAISEMEKNIAEAPLDARNHLFQMTLLNSATGYNPALYDKIVQIGLKALELSPTRAQFYYVMGQARISQGRQEEGINYFKKAVEISPVQEAHWNLAAAYIIIGNDKLADRQFQILEESGFKFYSMENLQKLINPYLIRKDYNKIAWLYGEMIKLTPNSANLYAKLAGAYKEIGEIEKAKQAALKALEIDQSMAKEVQAFIDSLK